MSSLHTAPKRPEDRLVPIPPDDLVTDMTSGEAPTPAHRRWLVGVVGTLIVLLVAAGIVTLVWWRLHDQEVATTGSGRHGGGGGGGGFGRGGPSTIPVVTATATALDVPITVQALGTVTPLATVTIHTQIAGVLQTIAFHEGQMVHQGDFLAQIDDRPYRFALAQATGQLERDQALLHDAQQDLERYAKLVTSESISRQTYDAQVALVAQDRGNCATDQAQIDTAKLNISYCHLVAPVAGRVGIRQVDAGNYVTPADANGIVVITQLDPMSVLFTVPEDQLPQILRRVARGATLAVTAYDRNEGTTLGHGALVSIDNVIDTATGTVKMRAQFNNEEGLLFPNQFVNIEVLVRTLEGAVTVPAAAVQQGAPGTFVWVVSEGPGENGKPGHHAHIRVVEPGPTANDVTAIVSGVKVGDTVVVQGADRLKDDAAVSLSPATPTPPHGNGAKRHGWHHRADAAGAADASASTSAAALSGSASGSALAPDAQGWSGPHGADDAATPAHAHHHHHRPTDDGAQEPAAESPAGQPAASPATPPHPNPSGGQQP